MGVWGLIWDDCVLGPMSCVCACVCACVCECVCECVCLTSAVLLLRLDNQAEGEASKRPEITIVSARPLDPSMFGFVPRTTRRLGGGGWSVFVCFICLFVFFICLFVFFICLFVYFICLFVFSCVCDMSPLLCWFSSCSPSSGSAPGKKAGAKGKAGSSTPGSKQAAADSGSDSDSDCSDNEAGVLIPGRGAGSHDGEGDSSRGAGAGDGDEEEVVVPTRIPLPSEQRLAILKVTNAANSNNTPRAGRPTAPAAGLCAVLRSLSLIRVPP